MAVNKVVTGGATYSDNGPDSALMDGKVFISDCISLEELAIDNLTATVNNSALLPTIFAPADYDALETADEKIFTVQPYVHFVVSDPSEFVYGQTVEYYRDEELFAKFYMESVKRVGKNFYEINCVSAMGLLDNAQHYGGIYTGQNMSDILADIIGGMVPYSLDPVLEETAVYGYLPIDSRRNNLHQLLFAEGASVKKDANGDLFFTALSDNSPVYIPNDRMFIGGSVDFGTPAKKIFVTEHAYTAYATDEVMTLFDGEAAASEILTPQGAVLSGALVTFSEPMHDLTINGGTILESGVNYAILGASSDCLLQGKAYTHTTMIVSRVKPSTLSVDVQSKDNEVSVTGATLVSMVNSENVADRMMSYYGYARKATCDLVVGSERPGDAVEFENAFQEQAAGFLQSMNITMSGILKASTDMITDFVPTPPGNYFNAVQYITEDGTFTVPEGTHKIRVVLIGGGQGGYSGGRGYAGGTPFQSSTYGPGGSGGILGPGGAGGKIYVVTIDVQPGDTFPVTIGVGGTGGVGDTAQNQAGDEGGATTFGDYSSDNGFSSGVGYNDAINATVFALPGPVGNYNGKSGSGSTGTGPSITVNGTTYKAGSVGASASGSGTDPTTGEPWEAAASGGAGGGAASGGNGNNGGNAVIQDNNGHGFSNGGTGGNGAPGLAGSNATVRGAGGQGGDGGGGGGAGGPSRHTSENYSVAGGNGTGGLGGTGGTGADGIILVYLP